MRDKHLDDLSNVASVAGYLCRVGLGAVLLLAGVVLFFARMARGDAQGALGVFALLTAAGSLCMPGESQQRAFAEWVRASDAERGE